jgi:hypothetical protein
VANKSGKSLGFMVSGKPQKSGTLAGTVLGQSPAKTSGKSSAASVLNQRDSKSGQFTSGKSSAASTLTQKDSKSGQFTSEKPGKGITMKESRQRMLKQLDASFRRLA